MPEPGAEPSIRGYLQVMRRGRWWVAAFSLLGVAIGLTLSLTATRQYSATAQLLVQSSGTIDLTTGDQSAITAAQVQTELQLVTSAPVQSKVRQSIGSTPGVSASQVGQTNVIAVTAVSPDPALAAKVANVYAVAFVDWSTATTISNLAAAENQLNHQIMSIGKQIALLPSGKSAQTSANSARASALFNQQAVLKGQLAQLQVAGASAATGLELVTPAIAPTSPSSPKPVQETLLGLAAGLIVGIGAAFLRDSLDDTLATGEAVEHISGAPVLATVPMVPMLRKADRPVLVSVSAPTSQPAEAYRSLRTSLQFVRHDRPLRTFLVTSPSAGDGKTTVVVNLGAVFAQAGVRVVLLSSDLRRPGLSQFLAPSEDADLCSVLAGERPLERAVTPVPGVEGLWALGARSYVGNPTELLAGQRMHGVVAGLAQQFDMVLIDSPPVLPVADALILSSYVDAVLLVVAGGQTRRGELRRTVEKLAHANAPVVGTVLNKASAQDEYGYYGAYQPYVWPGNTAADGGAARNGRSKQNGAPLPSGQPRRLDH
jgi:succinoglycan biosynthesis transport protein ExoP